MSPHSTEFSSPARYAALPELMFRLAGLAAQLAIPAGDLPRLQLVLEELFSNSIDHGYGKECDETIVIDLRAGASGVTLIYRDSAPAFDLTQRTASNPVDDQIGGLGINLIIGMARALRYQRQTDGNRLEIDF